jgi:hypothetical protein
MKIEIEISEENEATAYPYWMIIPPGRNSKEIAMMMAGPFFSRQEAQDELDSRRYYYGKKAVVWCLSGNNSRRYRKAIDDVKKYFHERGLLMFEKYSRVIDFFDIDGSHNVLDGNSIHRMQITGESFLGLDVVRLLVYWDSDIERDPDSVVGKFKVKKCVAEEIFKKWSDFMNSPE